MSGIVKKWFIDPNCETTVVNENIRVEVTHYEEDEGLAKDLAKTLVRTPDMLKAINLSITNNNFMYQFVSTNTQGKIREETLARITKENVYLKSVVKGLKKC